MKRVVVNSTQPDWGVIQEVVTTLKKGGVAALPTETVYGLAALKSNDKAVKKLCELKKRPKDKPFTVCFADTEKALGQFAILPPFAYRIIEKFWPGPLTIIYHLNESDEAVGIRIPDHAITSTILREVNASVYLSSANLTNEQEITSAGEVEAVFKQGVDIVVESDIPLCGEPSTVIDLTYSPFKVLREGVIDVRDLMVTFFKKRIVFVCTGNTCRSPMAEYLLRGIFAEKFPYLLDRFEVISRGILSLDEQPASHETAKVLSEQENIDASTHLSRKIDRFTILSSDLIFVMEEMHKERLLKIEPLADSRIFPLRKFLPHGAQKDIADPMGKTRDAYEDAFRNIKEALSELVEWLS